ncbi:MAG: dienelactone hydrolase family protein [SAR324 cluster bacterium]|nr:dienelactone hydrolase family protein [SAR324 cluster bacterium]
MQEKHVEIETADGKMDTFITHPDGQGPYAGVILYMDAPGIREELYDFARRVGTVGYYCMVPDLYYRGGRIRYDRSTMTPGQREDMTARWHAISNAMVMDDTRGMLRFLDGGEPVLPGPKGSIGYCMSGQYVLTAAGVFPEVFQATATLHGVRHITDQEDSPHLLAPKFRGEMYCGFAETDAHVPLEQVEELRQAFAPCAFEHIIEVHPGTEHGYSFPEREVYQMQAAERNWERIFAMFRRRLGAGT